MDLDLKNKVALVAAASRGLGSAVAWALAREGTKLVICARDKNTLEKTADNIFLETGVSVFPLAVDLSDKDQVDWLVDETFDLFGRVDILVTNAGGPPPGNFEDMSDAMWEKAIQTNVMSAIRLSRAVIPSMQKQKWGRIIHMTSAAVKQPIPGLTLSNVLRPSIMGLTKSLAQELAPYNVLVNAVCPGYFRTDRLEEIIRDKARESNQSVETVVKNMLGQIPMGRLGKPEELADLIVFLASERASYITGSFIQVDGGFVKAML